MKKKSSKAPKGRSHLDELAMTDSDNEIEDGFAAGSDRIALEKGAAAGSDDIDEEAVYDLDDEDEDDSDDDDIDDDEALEEALLQGGQMAQLAKQARYLEQKLKIQRGEADEDDEEQEEQQQQPGLRDKLWGANKRAYYQEEEQEPSDDEALQEEEQEVRRLQQQQAAALDDDDYGLPSSSRQQQQQGEPLMGDLAAAGAAGAAGVEVETVAKDLGALTAEEQLAVVMADAPELLSLLEELKACLAEVRSRVGPLLREVSAGGLATSAGLSYLEAKHLLLLQYCMCIVAYLMLKAEGRSVKDHPVIGRLVQLRAYIEKIRPIDKQLSYQIDKLLRATSVAQAQAAADAGAGAADEAEAGAAAAAAGGDDALRYRPNPGALIAKAPLLGDAAGMEAAGGGVYRPPKLNPVAMEEDRALSAKERRKLLEAQRRAQRSSVMREMAEELAGAPEEVRAEIAGMESAAAVATRQRLEARSAAEEELMLRVPLSKQEAKKLKMQRRAGLSGAAGLTDFADDVADLVAASGEGGDKGGSLAALYGKKQLSQRYGADLATQQSKMRSGDADVLPQKPLHERRAAFDAVAARRAAAAADSDGFEDAADMGVKQRKRKQSAADFGGEEDELYAATKAAKASLKAEKRRKQEQQQQLEVPLAEPEAVGQRKISYEIEKNRGLTPHRNKDLKNPRKKHRIKFAQAVVRRKGQVQGVQAAPSAPRGYAGEATGIKAKLAKSTRLG
ncbi:hypothetical protein OEZ85_000794 [Tetradesmus obliquus]|uniref:Sas10 C-terminal domain-containing protein n=1 Tax=Tetradesmus obliquus TaxID=3088 RepID=A0ABY8UJS1_TETOB|nr:hypothetical protein OEZ85_000794 [Tetradesmus obliquus]